jgi:hypothetical protein
MCGMSVVSVVVTGADQKRTSKRGLGRDFVDRKHKTHTQHSARGELQSARIALHINNKRNKKSVDLSRNRMMMDDGSRFDSTRCIAIDRGSSFSCCVESVDRAVLKPHPSNHACSYSARRTSVSREIFSLPASNSPAARPAPRPPPQPPTHSHKQKVADPPTHPPTHTHCTCLHCGDSGRWPHAQPTPADRLATTRRRR